MEATPSLAKTPPPTPQTERRYQAWGQASNQNVASAQNGAFVAVDQRGNVAVSSVVLDSGDNNEFYTAEYDAANGELLWSAIVDTGSGNCTPTSIAVDGNGNVLVTGGYNDGGNTLEDMYTVKYAGALSDPNVIQPGTKLWAVRHNGPNSGSDEATKVVVDSSNNVIVTGKQIASYGQYQIYTAKYAGSNGALLWSQVYSGSAHAGDQPAALAVNASGEVAVAGFTNDSSFYAHFVTLRYNSSGTPIWYSYYNSPNSVSYYGATGVAIDSAGNVVVTGVSTNASASGDFYTAEYASSNGAVLWSRTVTANNINGNGPIGVSLDRSGNPVVAGGYNSGSGTSTYLTIKYGGVNDPSPGETLWQAVSTPAGGGDTPVQVAVDAASNTTVTGISQAANGDANYYTVKYDNTGTELWEYRFDDTVEFNGSGNDNANGVAVDSQGNVVVTGVANLPYYNNGQNTNTFINQAYTVKYSRVIAAVGDYVPDGSGATYKVLNTPAIANSGAVAVRVTVIEEKKPLAAIMVQSGAGLTSLVAVQGQPAPGTSGKYASFKDPVMSPDGAYAFAGTISGVKASEASGVWSNFEDGQGPPQLLLQEGAQAPGLLSGTLVKSIESLAETYGDLWAVITISAKGIPAAESTVLINLDIFGRGANFVQPVTESLPLGASSFPIKSITTLLPGVDSPGEGRWATAGQIISRMSVTDKANPSAEAIAVFDDFGDLTPILYSGENVPTNIPNGSGATWSSFGLPSNAAGSKGTFYAALGNFQMGKMIPKEHTALVFRANGSPFRAFAVAGQSGPKPSSTQTSSFESFLDPVVNDQGDVAFLSKLSVSTNGGAAKAETAICWGNAATSSPLSIAAMTGQTAVDSLGNTAAGEFSAFTSMALPNGAGSGPIFLATVSGKGVTGKNHTGLWAVNVNGDLREVLRLGDLLGSESVTGITMLQTIPNVSASGRSYNGSGTAAAYVTLSDKTEELIHVDLP